MESSLISALIYVYIFALGVCLGSFVNAAAYRLSRGLSFVKGRSFCPRCRHELGPKDLVPILSYVFLKGRCRYCKGRISPRYIIVELLGGLFAAASYARFGVSWHALAAFVALMLLLAISLVDIETMEIPNGLLAALCAPAAASVFTFPDIGIVERIIGFFSSALPMLILALVIRDCFGGADIKLSAITGFMLGWKCNLLAAFIAIVGGGICAIILLKVKKADRKSHFAFGPFIALGAAVSLFFGTELISFYLGLFGY